MSVTSLTPHPGRPIRGPRALGDDWPRFWHLTLTIAKNEFKLRFFGSVLGYFWQLMRPLLLFGVLYLVFTKILKTGEQVPHWPAVLLGDVVLLTFFSEATSSSVRSVIDREALVRKIQFPRLVIPLSVVLTSLFNLSMNLVVVLIFAFAQGVRPHVSWIEAPLVLAILAMLACGVAMLLSSLFVRFRDIQPIWDVTAQILFYASPIIYTAAQYKGLIRVAMANPIAAILTQMHHAFVDPHAHDVGTVIGGPIRLLIPLAIIAGVFALGMWFFNREAPRIAENL
jgi:ABC-2 type transport system permease protein